MDEGSELRRQAAQGARRRVRNRQDRPRSETGLDYPWERQQKRRTRCCFTGCTNKTFQHEKFQWPLCEHHFMMIHHDIERFGGVHNLPLHHAQQAERLAQHKAFQDAQAQQRGVPAYEMFASRAHEAPAGYFDPPEPEKPNPEGVVYYLRVGGFIKIGWTSDLSKRMRSYSPDSVLLATEPGAKTVEQKRHKQFAVHRTHGREWFAMVPPLMHHIDRLKAEHGEPNPVAFSAQPVKVPQPRSRQYVGGNNRGNWQRGETPSGKTA